MSRLKLEGVWSTNRLDSSATGVASSNQVLMVVAVISPSIRERTLAQRSAGKFTERPPLSSKWMAAAGAAKQDLESEGFQDLAHGCCRRRREYR